MFGSKPTIFSEPSLFFTVSFFASAESSESVFGGRVIPAFLKSVLL